MAKRPSRTRARDWAAMANLTLISRSQMDGCGHFSQMVSHAGHMNFGDAVDVAEGVVAVCVVQIGHGSQNNSGRVVGTSVVVVVVVVELGVVDVVVVVVGHIVHLR